MHRRKFYNKNIKGEENDSLKEENKIFSDKSEIENNEIKIDSGKYDNTSNINNIKRINILENEVDKNNKKNYYFFFKLFIY